VAEDVIHFRKFERRSETMKKILMTVVFLISLIFISAQVGFGGEPPPEGYTIGGPSVVGQVMLENQRDGAGNELGYMTFTFRGFCKWEYVKDKICYFPFPAIISTFADITKDLLLNFILYGQGPSDCNSECGGEDIIVTKVNNFRRTASSKNSPYKDIIIADIVFRFLIPQ
jgi:hypothetical protein